MIKKFNFRILVAVAIIIGAVYWAYASVNQKSYASTQLSFTVEHGTVTVTNPLNEPVEALLSATGSRGTFSITSTNPDWPRSSTREGTGSAITHSLALSLQPGVNSFQLNRNGTDVTFTASASRSLRATVNPYSDKTARNTVIAAIIVVLVSGYYIARATGNDPANLIRRKISEGKALLLARRAS
jgi:hypothetical protein